MSDPAEARALQTALALIRAGGPFPFAQDGVIFGNREGRLQFKPYGYYKEYTVHLHGVSGRGALRIVAGAAGEMYYSRDHYGSFTVIEPHEGSPALNSGFSDASAPPPHPPRHAYAFAAGAVVIDADGVADKAGFLALIATELGFPAYFGRNWDAVDECLRDMLLNGQLPRAIVLQNAARLRDADPSVLTTFGEIVGALTAPGEPPVELVIQSGA